MNLYNYLLWIPSTCLLFCVSGVLSEENKHLVKKRHRRYVAFPEGSTFIATLCLTLNVLSPVTLFLEGLNWGISYDLPNATTVNEVFKNKNKYVLKRKQRRDLYNRVETVMEKMGYEGKPCIYRAICEASRKLDRKNNTLGQDLLRLFFKYPLKRLSYEEPDDHRLYHWATRRSIENRDMDCTEIFPSCSISFIDMALGGT